MTSQCDQQWCLIVRRGKCWFERCCYRVNRLGSRHQCERAVFLLFLPCLLEGKGSYIYCPRYPGITEPTVKHTEKGETKLTDTKRQTRETTREKETKLTNTKKQKRGRQRNEKEQETEIEKRIEARWTKSMGPREERRNDPIGLLDAL